MTAPHGLCRLAPVRGGRVDWDTAHTIRMTPVKPLHTDPKLTARQRRIVDFIHIYLAAHGYPPTVREISAGVGYKSTNTAAYQLGRLEAKGLIERPTGGCRSRALRLVQPGEEN